MFDIIALTKRLITPGVRIERRVGVPIYYCDDDNPSVLIRELNGEIDRGYMHKGDFICFGKQVNVEDRIEESIKYLLQSLHDELGLDITDPNFIETPKRVSKAYREIFSGIKDIDHQIDLIIEKSFPSTYDEMIVSGNNIVYSVCPHHLMIFESVVDIGYIPSKSGRVLGLSKLSRIADLLSKRPVLQEQLTVDIGKAIERVNPLGVAVRIRGEHSCVRARGVKKQSYTVTSYTSGAFRESPATRAEFFAAIKE